MGTASEAADMADTSIRVSEELAEELYQRKGRGTSYEDFLWEVLDRVDADEEPHDKQEESETGDTAAAPSERAEPLREGLRDALAGSGDLLEQRVDAILSMYTILRERGSAEKDELLDAVDVDATGYASRGSVWSNMVKGKDTLRALPGVEPPQTGKTVWKYTDSEHE